MNRKKKISDNDSFCILPFIQISIKHGGQVSACCESETIGDFYNESLLSVWNNDYYKQIRKKCLTVRKTINVIDAGMLKRILILVTESLILKKFGKV